MPHPPRCLWIGHWGGDYQRSPDVQASAQSKEKEERRLAIARVDLAILEWRREQLSHYPLIWDVAVKGRPSPYWSFEGDNEFATCIPGKWSALDEQALGWTSPRREGSRAGVTCRCTAGSALEDPAGDGPTSVVTLAVHGGVGISRARVGDSPSCGCVRA